MGIGVRVGPPLPICTRHHDEEAVRRFESIGLGRGNALESRDRSCLLTTSPRAGTPEVCLCSPSPTLPGRSPRHRRHQPSQPSRTMCAVVRRTGLRLTFGRPLMLPMSSVAGPKCERPPASRGVPVGGFGPCLGALAIPGRRRRPVSQWRLPGGAARRVVHRRHLLMPSRLLEPPIWNEPHRGNRYVGHDAQPRVHERQPDAHRINGD